MPANDTAGSYSSAHTDPSDPRKVLFPIIRDMMRVGRLPGDITDAILAAGFARCAQHDGEMVAIVRGAGCQCSDADACRFVRERDEAQGQIAPMNLALLAIRAERDALAAKLADAEREVAEYAKDSDYADDAFLGMVKIKNAAESRAAALAEALTKIRDYCGEMQDRESGPSMHPAAKRLVDDAMHILGLTSAALAGNGTAEDDGPPVTPLGPTDRGTQVVNTKTGKRHEWDGTAWRPLPAAPPTAGEKQS